MLSALLVPSENQHFARLFLVGSGAMALNNVKNANRPKRRWPPGRSEDVQSLSGSGLSGLPTPLLHGVMS